ncbi:macrophage mannose receptor 1-like [Centropristis striata]|uniref:macrophage mannose receptor 1-like n=1 Tax=Centropristis striata TaxID=184440 RepID=UPI0027DFAE38|nr:macrophage mannose receptor 1-like [Centropristis striata]
MKITCIAFVLLIQTLRCLASDDSPFELTNKATGFCLVKRHDHCYSMFWVTGDRLMVSWTNKCVGVQGKNVGSGISLYDCDEKNDLQKWECKNGTALALKGHELYIELTADNTAVLSRTIGPNNHLTISGTSSGACSRTYRELYTTGGNANGRPCMFPFMFRDQWYTSCTTVDSPNRPWCAVETKYDHELFGYCPVNTREHWSKDATTGSYYQLNTQAALTWQQAETSCKQQSASLLSLSDPHDQAFVSALLGAAGRGQEDKLWTGMTRNQDHGWQWANGKPYRYLNWDSGHPLPNPGYNCAIMDGTVQYSWQSLPCNKKLGYICYSPGQVATPTQAATSYCSKPWIPYNGHCFYLNRTKITWLNAQKACRRQEGDLVAISNVEDQSFVISQLGYASTDELWIGLNDRRKEGLFDWSDTSTVSFTSWENGAPAVSTDREDCVLIRGENGNWADRVCDEKHGYICMKISDSGPSGDEVERNIGCKPGWSKHGSYCYFVGTETKTFDQAKEDCKATDSYLADVSNGVDNAYLVSLVGLRPEKHFWLGLSNQKDIDQFVWTNKNPVRYTHWNAEMPGHQQGCVAMTTGVLAGLWDVLPCTNTSKYICKHLAEGAAVTRAPPTVPPPKCADGWTRMATKNFCTKVFSESSYSDKKTWYDARDYCRAIGGDLLSIHNPFDQIIGGYSRVWIGLSAPDPVTGYVWSDGSPVNFQHWEDGQPDNKNNVESCAEYKVYNRGHSGSWNDEQCEKHNDWVCQIRAGATPKPPPGPVIPDYNKTSDGWVLWNGTQYYFNTKEMAMEEARSFCQQRHADLVSINSEAEAVFLWKQISQNRYFHWIGLTIDLDGTFTWMDGSQVLYQRWHEGQPDFKNYDENCASMSPWNGFWHDYNCGFEHMSICKRSISPPTNTTVPPTVAPEGGCSAPWKKFNSQCYFVNKKDKLTWEEARKQCQAMSGNLASISSRHVEVFLMSQMVDTPTTDLWIGFHSSYSQGFYWTDGRPRKYVNLGFDRGHIPYWYYYHHSGSFARSRLLRGYYYQQKKCVVLNTNSSLGIGKWKPKSCNDTNGFICGRKVVLIDKDSTEPTISTGYVKILNDSMKVVTQQMNWDAANKQCESEGGKLASLRNEWSQAYVELLAFNLKAPLWIGLNKEKTNGFYKFTDGWHMTISHWGRNEPNKSRPCIYVDVDGKWKSAYCNETMKSVCMTSTDVAPTETSSFPGICPADPDLSGRRQNYFWKPFKGYCYIFFTQVKNWADASSSCVRHGGSLASIEDPDEQEFIKSNAKTFEDSHTSFWIGLFRSHKGEWQWLDRTVMDFTNWATDQPESNDWGGISSSDGTWITARSYYYRPYICKTRKVQPTTPPSPSTSPPAGVHLRSHIALAGVVVLTGLAMGAAIAFFLIKKFSHRLPIPAKLSTFENPLFFSNQQSDDTNKLIENEEEENPEPIITL